MWKRGIIALSSAWFITVSHLLVGCMLHVYWFSIFSSDASNKTKSKMKLHSTEKAYKTSHLWHPPIIIYRNKDEKNTIHVLRLHVTWTRYRSYTIAAGCEVWPILFLISVSNCSLTKRTKTWVHLYCSIFTLNCKRLNIMFDIMSVWDWTEIVYGLITVLLEYTSMLRDTEWIGKADNWVTALGLMHGNYSSL